MTWERHFTALSPAWWSLQAVLNFIHISIKFQADSNILASPEAGRGNCLPYVLAPPSLFYEYRNKVKRRMNTALSPAWWSLQAVLNFIHISIKFQADSNILASPEAGRGNCLPYVLAPPSLFYEYRNKVKRRMNIYRVFQKSCTI